MKCLLYTSLACDESNPRQPLHNCTVYKNVSYIETKFSSFCMRHLKNGLGFELYFNEIFLPTHEVEMHGPFEGPAPEVSFDSLTVILPVREYILNQIRKIRGKSHSDDFYNSPVEKEKRFKISAPYRKYVDNMLEWLEKNSDDPKVKALCLYQLCIVLNYTENDFQVPADFPELPVVADAQANLQKMREAIAKKSWYEPFLDSTALFNTSGARFADDHGVATPLRRLNLSPIMVQHLHGFTASILYPEHHRAGEPGLTTYETLRYSDRYGIYTVSAVEHKGTFVYLGEQHYDRDVVDALVRSRKVTDDDRDNFSRPDPSIYPTKSLTGTLTSNLVPCPKQFQSRK
jgi:hypothetical protein